MKYPATVIVVAVVVTIILMVKVVPVFQDLFFFFWCRFTCIHPNGREYVEMDAGILVHYDYCDWSSDCCLSGSQEAQ